MSVVEHRKAPRVSLKDSLSLSNIQKLSAIALRVIQLAAMKQGYCTKVSVYVGSDFSYQRNTSISKFNSANCLTKYK